MIDLKLLLARILTKLILTERTATDLKTPDVGFSLGEHRLYSSGDPLAVSAGTSTDERTKTFTKPGYYPLAISGWDMNGTMSSFSVFTSLCITKQEVGKVEVMFSMRNLSTNTALLYADIYVLWLKVI